VESHAESETDLGSAGEAVRASVVRLAHRASSRDHTRSVTPSSSTSRPQRLLRRNVAFGFGHPRDWRAQGETREPFLAPATS